MEVLLCQRVNDLRHSLFHLLCCLITTDSELREYPKVTGSKVWTTGWLRNCFDAHLCQIVCDKDGVVNWCIVLVEMPLTRFEECWPLPTESFPELPLNLNIVTLTLWPINSDVLTYLLLPHLSSSLTDSVPSLNLLCHSKTDARFMQDAPKAVWNIPYVSVVSFFSKFKTILLHIVLLKCPHVQIVTAGEFQKCNQALVGCIPIAAVAVHLNLKS